VAANYRLVEGFLLSIENNSRRYSRGASADVKEGVVSFLEKRPAKFPQKVSSDMPPYFPWWQPRKYS
jgi:hypothetical protein